MTTEKTAVAKITLLLIIIMMPLLGLTWTTQLMAQAEQPRPDFIIATPTFTDKDGDDTYQIRFVGLAEDDDEGFFEVAGLEVMPADAEAGIEISNTMVHSLAEEPFYLSLLVDSSGSMVTHTAAIQEILHRFISEQLSDTAAARLTLISFNGQVLPDPFQPFTDDLQDMEARIAQLQTHDGPTCLYNTAYAAVQSLAQLPQNPRRALVIFSDGQDEITRGQPPPCSEEHDYEEVLLLAQAQPVPIPIHTINFAYSGPLSNTMPLASNNTILEGLTTGDSMSDTVVITKAHQLLQHVVDSFQHQFAVTITLYTPTGTHTLDLTPTLAGGASLSTQPLAYSAQYEHYPAVWREALAIHDVTYDEAAAHFNIDITLCQNAQDNYCHADKTSELTVEIEDRFTHRLTTHRLLPPDQFMANEARQTITAPIHLLSEHPYLLRVTAKNGITSDNYHPRAEANFTYSPQLTATVHQAQLHGGFTLQPELTVSLSSRRMVTQAEAMQPERLLVGGHLLYQRADGRDELYELPNSWLVLKAPVPAIIFTMPGNLADSRLLLDIAKDPPTLSKLPANQPNVDVSATPSFTMTGGWDENMLLFDVVDGRAKIYELPDRWLDLDSFKPMTLTVPGKMADHRLLLSMVDGRVDLLQLSDNQLDINSPIDTALPLPGGWGENMLLLNVAGGRVNLYELPDYWLERVTTSFFVPGGWGDYRLLLQVADGRDGVRAPLIETKTMPETWWGSLLLQTRFILERPLLFVLVILFFLLLLALVALAVWIARRSVVVQEQEKAEEAVAVQPQPRLHVDATPDDKVRRATFPILDEVFVIGRRPESHLAVQADAFVAERHAEIRRENGHYTIVNCDPAYSTFINDDEIISQTPIPIFDQDHIRLGSQTRLTLRLTPEEEI